jgi:hypothetical protein
MKSGKEDAGKPQPTTYNTLPTHARPCVPAKVYFGSWGGSCRIGVWEFRMARALIINVATGSLAGGSLGWFLCRVNMGFEVQQDRTRFGPGSVLLDRCPCGRRPSIQWSQ